MVLPLFLLLIVLPLLLRTHQPHMSYVSRIKPPPSFLPFFFLSFFHAISSTTLCLLGYSMQIHSTKGLEESMYA
ncbi:hypothetical protein BDF14DRAFT_1760845 [Spinellus fusiger]|nr:hypothetical protein BDF14DRAFT_1760845 [Spinellus fusiger]